MANTIDIFKNAKFEQEKLVGENNFFKNKEEIVEQNKLQERFLTNTIYAFPENFARFGSAEEYYKTVINYINNDYPYDKSKAVKDKWVNSLNDFEYYIFKKSYPRYAGYLQLSESQKLYIYSPSQQYVTSSLLSYKNGIKYYTTASLDLNTGFMFESWMRFPTSSQATNIMSLWHVVSSSATGLSSSALTNLKVNSANFILSGSTNYTFSNYVIPDDEWHHYSFAIYSSSAKLFVDGQLKDTLNSISISDDHRELKFSKIGLLSSSYQTTWQKTGSYTAKPVFEIGGDNYLYLDETRFWNEPRTIEFVGRNWRSQIDGNDFNDPYNNNLIFYYKFNEGWDISGSYSLDYSGRENDGLINNFNAFSCRFSGSAIDSSNLVEDKEEPSIIIESSINNSGTLNNYYNNLVNIGYEYDLVNPHMLYKKFPSWVLDEELEVSGATPHLKQLVQIISYYFDDLYNKISEISKYKHQQNTDDLQYIYPFYDKILSSTGFDVIELFQNLSAIEKIASKNDIDTFNEEVKRVKNGILQNIYNNLSYILKTKGTEKSIKTLLRSYGINENLVKINLYADGTQFNITDRSFPTVVRKKVLEFNNNQTVYCTSSLLFNNFTSSFTFETSVYFPSKYDPTGSNHTSSIFGFNFSDSSRYSRTLDAYVTLLSDITGSKFYFYTGSSIVGTSSYLNNVYDNSIWNFALRLKPDYIDEKTAPANNNYILELTGVNKNTYQDKTFYIGLTASDSERSSWNNNYVNFYIGARNTNFSGNVEQKTNIKYLYCNFWNDYLSDEEIISHNKDITNYGVNQ